MGNFPPMLYGKSVIYKSLKENLTYKKPLLLELELLTYIII